MTVPKENVLNVKSSTQPCNPVVAMEMFQLSYYISKIAQNFGSLLLGLFL